MSSQNEDFDEAAAAEEMERHGLELHQLVQDYLDEHDLSDQVGAIILLGICIRMHMVGYALGTERPSASGLKMDLDRFGHEIEDCLRTAKKGAAEFIEQAKALKAEAEAELDAEDEADDKRDTPS